jgi:hypothetical protein
MLVTKNVMLDCCACAGAVHNSATHASNGAAAPKYFMRNLPDGDTGFIAPASLREPLVSVHYSICAKAQTDPLPQQPHWLSNTLSSELEAATSKLPIMLGTQQKARRHRRA